MTPLGSLRNWIELRGGIVELETKIQIHRLMNNNVSAATVIGSLLRTAIAGLGGGLIADGTVTSDQVNTLSGAGTIVIVLGWSLFQKWRAKQAAR